MPIFRYDSNAYDNSGTPEWKAMSNIYRWNGSVWQKIKKIYRFNDTIAAKWQLIFQGTDAPQPKVPYSSLYRSSDGETEAFYSGNTVRLSRGGWTQNPTTYRLRIQTSPNAASGYTTVTDQTYNSSSSPTASNTTDSTYISYTITNQDALYPSYYIKGLVQATNADGTTPLETPAILLRIAFTLSNLSASSITGNGATFSWNISGVPTESDYIYDQTLTIRRVSDDVVVKTVNIAPGTNTVYVNDSAAISSNTAYYAKLVVTANDSWRDDATSPTTRTIDNYLFTTAGNPPQNTIAPTITPLNNRSYLPVSTELTANKGTWSNVSASTTYEYDWWIEDGITGVVTNSGYIGSTRTYTSIYAGDYLFVRVKATNPDGTYGTAVSQSYVLDQAVAVSQVTPTTALPNVSTNFSFSISHYPTSYVVDWGDGTSNSYTVSSNTATVNQTIAHTYTSSGSTIITITAQPGSKQSLTSIDVNYPLPGNLTSVESYNFTAGYAQSFFTTGTNTTKVVYFYDCISIPSLGTSTYTQNTVSSTPYKIQDSLLSQFTLEAWNNDTYSPSATYYLNNTVWYAGNQYRLTTTNYSSTFPYPEIGVSGQVPTNTAYWTRIQTVTYVPGDYVLFNGAYYFCKTSTNGTYPNNSIYWIPDSTGISFQLYATPYNVTRSGTQVAASNIVIRTSVATSPLQISTTPTFSNITSTGFRTTFLPSVYTNQVDFYIQKSSDLSYLTGFSGIALTNSNYWILTEVVASPWNSSSFYSVGTKVWYNDNVYTCTTSNAGVTPTNTSYWSYTQYLPNNYSSSTLYRAGNIVNNNGSKYTATSYGGYIPKVLSVTGASYNIHDNVIATDPSTQYLVTINARYVYNSLYNIYHNGSGLSAYVTTAAPPPTISGISLYDSTVSPSSASSLSVGNSATTNVGSASWTNGSNTTYANLYSVSGAGTGGAGTDPTSLATSGTFTISSTGTANVTIRAINNTKRASVTWTQSGAQSYSISYDISGIAGNPQTATGNSDASNPDVLLLQDTTSRTVTLRSITLYSGLNQTGTSLSTSNTSSVTPTNKTTNTTGSGSVTYSSPAPGTPTSLTATTNRTDGVNLTFSGSSGATSYDIFWNFSSSGTPGSLATPDFSSVTSPYLDTGIAAGATRYYWVRGKNADGITSAWYPSVTGVTGTRTQTVPNATAPTSVTAVSAGTTAVTVSWSGATNATKYRIWWSTSSTGNNFDPATSYDAETTSTSYTFTTLTTGTTYYFWVSASNTNSVWTPYSSSPRGQATPSSGTTTPATPTGVGLSGSGVVTWTASSGATSYEIEFFTSQNSTGLNVAPTTATGYTVTGISGSPYQLVSPYAAPNNYARVRVRARNSAGASAYSAWVPSATTYT